MLYDAYLIDDADRLICMTYVDLRKTADRSPMTTLIKGRPKQYAIENLKQVRISKPEQFRKRGDGLIKDPSEAQASHTEIASETTDDPRQLQLLTEAVDGISKRLQAPIEITSLSTRVSHKATDAVIDGKNGWIFSTSIEPTNQEEHARWRNSLPEEYDHVSYIRGPREFARVLGLMVAEQLGPQGQETEMNRFFSGTGEITTRHKSQLVFHGPVIYVADRYATIANAPSESEAMLLPVFVKGMERRDQRERRFVIWAEQEPSNEFEDLDASMALLGAMQERLGQEVGPAAGCPRSNPRPGPPVWPPRLSGSLSGSASCRERARRRRRSPRGSWSPQRPRHARDRSRPTSPQVSAPASLTRNLASRIRPIIATSNAFLLRAFGVGSSRHPRPQRGLCAVFLTAKQQSRSSGNALLGREASSRVSSPSTVLATPWWTGASNPASL